MTRTLYRHGAIYPLTSPAAVEALITDGGRVVAAGGEAAMRELAGPTAREVDLDGAVLLPGLIDAHPHLLHYGSLHEPLVDILDARTHADVIGRIAARAVETPPGDWIMTTPVGEPHYFLRRSFRDLAEGELPDRHALDGATTAHPIVIQAWAPTLPSTIAFNSAALAQLGIDRDTPDKVGNVWIEKDDEGDPTGRLHGSVVNYYAGDEFAARLWQKIPFLDYRQLLPGTKSAMRDYHRMGVTAVYENHMMDGRLLDAYRELRDAGELELRVTVAQEAEAYGMPWSKPRARPDFVARLERAAAAIDVSDDYLRFNGVTVMWDGTANVGGMMMRDPYTDPYGRRTCGFHNIAPDKAEMAMRFCAERQIRLNLICMGTEAHEEALAVLERLAADHDLRALRWILVHAVFIEPEQIRRYRRLGFDLTTSMSFVWGKGDFFREHMGADVLADLMPLRRFFDAGLAVAGSSDWGPKSAFEQIQLALTHEFARSGHRNLGAAQRITRHEAVAMWTTHGARVLQWNGIGGLGPDAYADLIILDRDPFTTPVEDLAGTRVLRTVFDGRDVHDTGDL